jgi:hypothetical protein
MRLWQRHSTVTPEPTPMKLVYCSFCGKSQNEVAKLIAGPTCFICNECVEICIDIIYPDDMELSG